MCSFIVYVSIFLVAWLAHSWAAEQFIQSDAECEETLIMNLNVEINPYYLSTWM